MCASSEPVSTMVRGAQVDLVVRHHADKLKDLLPAGDKARPQHVVHAEGLGGRGGRRGGAVRRVRKLLAQLQVVQNEPVAVIGNAQTVSIGGGGKVGADPGGQPCASVRALRQQRPVQRAQRGVNPVEVAAPVRGQKAVGQADLVDDDRLLRPARPGLRQRPALRRHQLLRPHRGRA